MFFSKNDWPCWAWTQSEISSLNTCWIAYFSVWGLSIDCWIDFLSASHLHCYWLIAEQGLKCFFAKMVSLCEAECEAWVCNAAPFAWYENCSTCVTGSRSPASYLSLSLASALLTLLKDDKQQLNCERTLLSEHSSILLLWLRFIGQPCREVYSIGRGQKGQQPLPVLLRTDLCMVHTLTITFMTSAPHSHQFPGPCWCKITPGCVDYCQCPMRAFAQMHSLHVNLGSKMRQTFN